MSDGGAISFNRFTTRRPSYDNLKDAAAAFIRDAIVSGELAPGSKVDQDEIADALGISRVPVREALIELAQKEFVVAVPRRGAFVAEVEVQDVEDHYEIVALVFGVATRRAVKKLTPADIEELHRLDGEVAAAPDADRAQELDRRFLHIIAGAGSSRRLDSVLRFIGGALPGSFYYESPRWPANQADYRTKLLAAIDAGDARAAAKVSETHLRGCADVVIEHLRSRGYWSTTG